LFWLGERVFHLDRDHVQTLMYLKLSVAGHLTIFLTRTRGPFWTIKPAKVLWIAVLGTQIIATFIAVYGLFMTPLGWKYAGLVWGYAILWALFTDRIKLLAYRVLDHVKPDEAKPEAKADKPKPEDKDKEQSNVTPQLVKRVHELYEELGREDVQTVQDWEKANPATGKSKSQK
jgi:H+-transporting ATPase